MIALNDAMAIGVLSALRARGVDVPGQISVAGFDDVAVAEDLAPSLTTVRLPMAEMGEMALTMALRPPSSRPRRKLTGHTLVVRDSTGPVPRSSGPEEVLIIASHSEILIPAPPPWPAVRPPYGRERSV